MDKLRLKNYRCFEDTGEVELKPLTLLLGANSSGKSSFIKFFPLLQQSLETKVNGLFLWDGQYVDFKNFKNTVRNGVGEITIDYTIGEMDALNMFGQRFKKLKEVTVSMTLAEKEEYSDYLKTLTISFDILCYKFLFNKDGKTCSIEVNGIKSEDYSDEIVSFELDNNLLPMIRFEVDKKKFRVSGSFSHKALEEINEFLGRINKNGLEFLLDERIIELLSYDYQSCKAKLKKYRPEENDIRVERVANVLIYFMAGQIVRSVNEYFKKLSRNFTYVLPLRSIMNRYYRFQNRSVDTIDPDGDNLAMFLNSLTNKYFDEFNNWLNEIFHFRLSIEKSEGHVEVYIEEELKPKRNLVDVGFGFTQILPILTIIWKSVYRNINMPLVTGSPITIAIEQPELHLHPRFQAYFTVMLAKVISFCKSKKVKLRIIIETHSEVIINKLGQIIGLGKENINKDDVNVVLFHANNEGLEKFVHSTGYSEDGGLINWPFGFFSEDVY